MATAFNKKVELGPQKSIGRIIIDLFKDAKFVLAVYALTNFKLVVTALQYWVPHYMKLNLGADEHLTVILVAATSITATAAGTLSGGLITTRCLGSYLHPRALLLCLSLLLLFTLAALPLSYLPSLGLP